MSTLNTTSNFGDADTFYAQLTELHRNCDREESEVINARLILLLANHIGDAAVLEQALKIAADRSPNNA